MARVWIFKVLHTGLCRREYLLFRCIIWSQWWRLRWLLLLWWWLYYLLFLYMFSLWAWCWRSGFFFGGCFRIFIIPFIQSGLTQVLNFFFIISPYIPRELILLMVGWSTSPYENMAPSDMNNDYKVRSFLHLHSGFGYTCTCHYLIVGSNVFHNGSSSKLNFRFVGSPTVPRWEGHNSSIRSAIEVSEHLMESLFDKISNRSGPISISCR
jgi:hypothetical protein